MLTASLATSLAAKLFLGGVLAASIAIPVLMRVYRPEPQASIGSSTRGAAWMREISATAGSKQARQLVLYRPSADATDRRLEFTWKVSDRLLAWTFRAKDKANYYAMAIKALRPGPSAAVSVEHFTVYQGIESQHANKVLILPAIARLFRSSWTLAALPSNSISKAMQPTIGPTTACQPGPLAFSSSRTNLPSWNRCGCGSPRQEALEMPAAAKPALRTQIEAALGLHSAGRHQEALDILTAPGENLPDFYTLRGDIQFALNRFEEAAGSYFTSATLEPQPGNANAQHRLGICLYQLGQWLEAGQAFQKVLESGPASR